MVDAAIARVQTADAAVKSTATKHHSANKVRCIALRASSGSVRCVVACPRNAVLSLWSCFYSVAACSCLSTPCWSCSPANAPPFLVMFRRMLLQHHENTLGDVIDSLLGIVDKVAAADGARAPPLRFASRVALR